jgi:hypothetical protein
MKHGWKHTEEKIGIIKCLFMQIHAISRNCHVDATNALVQQVLLQWSTRDTNADCEKYMFLSSAEYVAPSGDEERWTSWKWSCTWLVSYVSIPWPQQIKATLSCRPPVLFAYCLQEYMVYEI